MVLSEEHKSVVWKLGGILRLADALDRSYENRIKNVKFKLIADNLVMKLVAAENYEVEQQAVENKKDLLEAAFLCKLEVL